MIKRVVALIALGFAVGACSRFQDSNALPGPGNAAGRPAARTAGFKTIFVFDGASGGAGPSGALIALNGILYGVTGGGGKYGHGTVFSLTTSGSETVLHSFDTDGNAPKGSLLAFKGVLYGATGLGGKANDGAIFALRTDGTEIWHYDFKGGWDGFNPQGGLTEWKNALYGATAGGGNYYDNAGGVFKITRTGKKTEVRAFTGGRDGGQPNGNLTLFQNAFYGTTVYGGVANGSEGVVYRLTASGNESLLHQFAPTNDGQSPVAGLVSVNSVFYGTTRGGGKYNTGTVFSITTDGTEQVIHNFGSGTDGEGPACVLVAYNGKLYGTTPYGGAHQQGTIFEMSPSSGKERVLYSFTGSSDGGEPSTGLLALGGVLYGTTAGNVSQSQYGTIFALRLK